jgi:hypothetical protein
MNDANRVCYGISISACNAGSGLGPSKLECAAELHVLGTMLLAAARLASSHGTPRTGIN